MSTRSVDDILRSATSSYWFTNALRTALDRDPIDALHDAEWLVTLLRERANAALRAARSDAREGRE